MSIRTQIRLEQITGSVIDFAPTTLSRGSTKELVEHSNLGDILKYYAQAITNIHGDAEFGAASVATFLGDSSGVNKFGNDGFGESTFHITASTTGLALSSRLTGQDIDFRVNSSGVDQLVLSITGDRKSLKLSGSNALEFRDENNKIKWEDDFFSILSAGSSILLSSSEETRFKSNSLVLDSLDINFTTDAPFNYAQTETPNEPMLFAKSGEAQEFQTRFDAQTSVLGAFNNLRKDLDAAILTAQSTIFTALISEQISAGSAVALSHHAGDSLSFDTSLEPFEAEVFVNGQLLFSGSSADVANELADYFVSGVSELKFGFSLEVDDRVTLIDRSIAPSA